MRIARYKCAHANKILIIAITVGVLGLFCVSSSAMAYEYSPMEKIPGFPSAKDFPDYVSAIIKFSYWAIGIAAVLMLSIGGFWYMTSAGNNARMEQAKGIIWDSILGVVMVLISWLILYTLNPQLVGGDVGSLFYQPTPPSAIPSTPTPPTTTLKCSASQNSEATNNAINCINAGSSGVILGERRTFEGGHKCNFSVNPPKISCHYGGRNCNGKSNAIDYGGPAGAGGGQKYQDIVKLAQSCGVSVARCEGLVNKVVKTLPCSDARVDHVHINVEGTCGCM